MGCKDAEGGVDASLVQLLVGWDAVVVEAELVDGLVDVVDDAAGAFLLEMERKGWMEDVEGVLDEADASRAFQGLQMGGDLVLADAELLGKVGGFSPEGEVVGSLPAAGFDEEEDAFLLG